MWYNSDMYDLNTDVNSVRLFFIFLVIICILIWKGLGKLQDIIHLLQDIKEITDQYNKKVDLDL